MKRLLMLWSVAMMTTGSAVAQELKEKVPTSRKERQAERLENEHVYRLRNFGVSLQNQQNTVVSPLIYKGTGISLAAERRREHDNAMKTNNARLQYNMMKAANSEYNTHSGAFQFGYDYLKKAFLDKLYLGGMVQMNGNIRFSSNLGNNAIQYELFPDIGLSSTYKTDFQLFGRDFGFDASLKLPLVGAVMATPKYTTSFDELRINVVSLNKMFNPQTQFWINFPANKRFPNRQRRIGYEWNMNRFGRGNDRHMTMATHSFYLVATLDKLK